jgi:uncharacterized protein (TIGR02265 family)
MAQIKGTNLAHVHAFVLKELGEPGLVSLRAALKPETQTALDSYIAASWYPANVYVELLQALDVTLGKGDGELLKRAGAYAAEYDLTRIHRVFFRLANPAFVLEKSMEIWSRFFDTGQWKVTRPTPTSADGQLHDFRIVDTAVCAYLNAYLQRLFELVGAKHVEVRHVECRARGGKVCRFAMTWS